MKYRKASDVLPDDLLREVQKYVNGEALYFPKHKERKKWGENSGARSFYRDRNQAIQEQFRAGESIDSLSKAYHLSVETIRKILYETQE